MRLASAFINDMRLQWRYGFYLAYAVVCAAYIVVLRLLPADVTSTLLPFVIFSDPAVFGLFFVGALVMLEKADGTLDSLFVTPLSPRTYVVAKVISLAALALTTSVVIAVAIAPLPHPALLVVAVLLTAAVFTLIGVGVAARSDTLNGFLITAGFTVGGFCLPLVDYLALWKSDLFFVIPTQGSLVLLGAAFTPEPLATGRLAAATASLIIWLGLAGLWSGRRFHRCVVRGGAA